VVGSENRTGKHSSITTDKQQVTPVAIPDDNAGQSSLNSAAQNAASQVVDDFMLKQANQRSGLK
jgi:hypothetical protein